MNSFKEEGSEQFERTDGSRGFVNNESSEHLSDAFEYFIHNGHRARYETELERKTRERLEKFNEDLNKLRKDHENKRAAHPAFCKPGTTIKSVVERPVMFTKPIEQFFDVDEAIIIEH